MTGQGNDKPAPGQSAHDDGAASVAIVALAIVLIAVVIVMLV